jgi:transposase
MARQPEVFVRELSPEDAQRLVKLTRSAKSPVRLRRSGIILASLQGRTVAEIAEMFAASVGHVREVIHSFNERGFDTLDPKWSGGRPGKTDPSTRERICCIARRSPRQLGEPFSTWSLPKLREHLLALGVIGRLSTETLRKVLHAGKVSWQATKTWKTSRDPDFAAKMARILDLYDHPPAGGRVICVDEFAPIEPAAPARAGLVRTLPRQAAAGHLPPRTRGAAPLRRTRPGDRADGLPHP